MTGARDADPVWRAFLAEPASYIHPSRLIGALNNELSAELCDSLRECERLQGRLSAVIASRAALPDTAHTDVVDPQDRDIATASADELAAIISRAGAVYWASAMAGAVRGQHVAALEGSLGAELCRFAVKHRELAGPAQPLEPARGPLAGSARHPSLRAVARARVHALRKPPVARRLDLRTSR